MKTFKRLLIVQCLILLIVAKGFAQDSTSFGTKPPTMKFLLSGDAYMGFRYTSDPNSSVKSFTFTNMGVNPVFLWKLSNRMLFEAEVEFQNRNPHPTGYAAGEGLEIELEYCNIAYFINDYLIIRAGTFFSTMGVFEDWHHQRITNKMISRPLGIGNQSGLGIESGTDLGFNFRGVIPCGSSKLNYSIDFTSGPRLILADDAAEGVHAGQLQWEGITDNNLNKALGGRLGFLPFSNSSLEIGVSAQTSKVGNYNGVDSINPLKDIGVMYMGADLCYNQD